MKGVYFLLFIILIFISCGHKKSSSSERDIAQITNSISSEKEESTVLPSFWTSYAVAKELDLPKCEKTRVGMIYYIEQYTSLYACTSSGWQKIKNDFNDETLSEEPKADKNLFLEKEISTDSFDNRSYCEEVINIENVANVFISTSVTNVYYTVDFSVELSPSQNVEIWESVSDDQLEKINAKPNQHNTDPTIIGSQSATVALNTYLHYKRFKICFHYDEALPKTSIRLTISGRRN